MATNPKTDGKTADDLLTEALEKIAADAPHLADPRDGVRAIAEAFLTWFKS